MERFDLYRDIAERTEGDIYIGVVGPVRTGKSTFITRMMDLLVMPNLESGYKRERTLDELPQSGSGKTIMTTQPKFVPSEAVEIEIGDAARVNVRMVDCVGYLVKGALGTEENETPRMVRTPWFDREIPFEEAAELGTRKVITDHSTIGVVVTTDGSIAEIPRTSYVEAEERVVRELQALCKPFVLVLNSRTPDAADTRKLRDALEEKYNVPVMLIDVLHMELSDVNSIMENVLFEFPLSSIHMQVPQWIHALDEEHWLVEHILEQVREASKDIGRVRDYTAMQEAFRESPYAKPPRLTDIELGNGTVTYDIELDEGLFYRILGEQCGTEVHGEAHLLSLMKELVGAKREYDRVSDALESVRRTGYGLVAPTQEELTLEEPELVKQGNRFGVKLKASAPSLHMIRVDIQTEVSPIVGTEKQSEELVQYLLTEFEQDPTRIWSTDMFGKSLHELVKEGLSNKLLRMPEDAQMKIQETLQRIINDGSGGMICILL